MQGFQFCLFESQQKIEVSGGFPKSAVVLEGQVRDSEDFQTPQILLRLLETLNYVLPTNCHGEKNLKYTLQHNLQKNLNINDACIYINDHGLSGIQRENQ